MLFHALENADHASDVIRIVFERHPDGLAYCLEAGEMNDAVDLVLIKDFIKSRFITAVDLIELEFPARYLL